MLNYWWLYVELSHVSAYQAWNISVKMWLPIRLKQYTPHAHYSIIVSKYIRGFIKADEGNKNQANYSMPKVELKANINFLRYFVKT